MYGHRCQDTQSPFRVRAESSRVSFPQITKVCWQRVIIQCVWLISIKWWHKILYCYRPSRLSHFEHPEVGPGVRAVRPGGDSLTCTRREGEREPALTLERGDLWSWSLSQGRRYLTPGYLRAGDTSSGGNQVQTRSVTSGTPSRQHPGVQTITRA